MPNRIIKESIRTSKSVNAMSDFQFRLWTYLLTYVDDYGRGSADPELLKGFVFPRRKGVTEGTIQKTLAELATIGSVILYEVDGEPYLCFPNWSEHQSVRNKVSKFPAPNDALLASASNCKQLKSTASICNQLLANVPVIQSESNPNPNPNTEESAPARHAHGQYGWVKLTGEEYSRLLADLGEAELARCIAYVDEAAQSTGNKNKWKDWNLTIRKCHRDGWGLDRRANRSASAPRDYSSLKDSFSSLDDIAENI